MEIGCALQPKIGNTAIIKRKQYYRALVPNNKLLWFNGLEPLQAMESWGKTIAMRHLLRILAVFLFAASPALAVSITGVAIEKVSGGSERVVFVADGPVTIAKSFLLASPDRVVVDIPQARATGIVRPAGYTGNLITNLRFGQFDPNTSRLVIDVSVPVRLVKATSEGSQLVIEIVPSAPMPPSVPVVAAPASPFAAIDGPTPPVVAEVKKPLIVLDPGHGGQDPGALGKKGTREKAVTLAMAKEVKNGLLRTGRYRVLLTRETDIYIPLQGRVDIARRANADVFISLHADSNPRAEAKGLSVYTLSDNASDEEAAALAEQENKSDIIAGLDLGTADEDVASILIDLTQRETMNKSATLADTLVAELHPKITKLPSTHRFAGFRVLKAPDVPSILIEMGFLSNATDERLLASHEYGDLVTTSIIRTLDTYMKE